MKFLGISGSLRVGSHNTMLLRSIAKVLKESDSLTIFEGLGDIPFYNEDIEASSPMAVQALRDAIEDADVIVFSTPEYNHSIPGGLKNAVDWISRPMGAHELVKKPVLVVGASAGMFGAVWAQDQLRKVLADALGADVVEDEFPLGFADQAFDNEGAIIDESLREAITQRVEALRSKHDKSLLQVA